MVKATSLLYAIYVCLIVALLCSALLYIANLYNQLNLFYTSREEMYVHNQSLVNFAASNVADPGALPDESDTGIQSVYEVRPYGLLTTVIARSVLDEDTVSSAHFVGLQSHDKTCIYLTKIGSPLFYSGSVVLSGEKKLPSTVISPAYIYNQTNTLTDSGPKGISEAELPQPSRSAKNILSNLNGVPVKLENITKNDSLYYNSFLNTTQELNISSSLLTNINIKGNIIIRSPDSIQVTSTAHLEDVILVAPVIKFDDGFKGSVQAFANNKISVGKSVILSYPSVLMVNNHFADVSIITVGDHTSVAGAIVMFGNRREKLESHSVIIEKECKLLIDIYCAGKLTTKSNLYGSVYTNKFLHKTESAEYENCIADIEIDPSKRPDYYLSIALFDDNKRYAPIKKLI